MFERVYQELRALAHRMFEREPGGMTLQPTALIHEVWFRLRDQPVGDHGDAFRDVDHYKAVASTVMRHILVDRARRKRTIRHGGEGERVDLEKLDGSEAEERDPVVLLAIDESLLQLGKLSRRGPRMVQVVEMRYFAGLSVEETARALGVDRATVNRDWKTARAFLSSRLGRGESPAVSADLES